MPRLSTILTWPLRHPLATIVSALICAAIAGLLASRLRADPSLQAMFSRSDPSAEALARVMSDFGAVDQLLVLASTPGSGQATPADIERLEQFGNRLTRSIPIAPETATLTDGAYDKPDSDSLNFIEHVVFPAAVYYLDNASFAAARDRLTKPELMRAQIRQDETMMEAPGASGSIAQALMRDPLRLREFAGGLTDRLQAQQPLATRPGSASFISPDGRNLLVLVRGKQPPGNLEFCKQMTHGVAAVANRVNGDGLELRYGGSYAIAAASATAIRSDMIASVVGSVLCLQLLFVLAYRSPFKLFALSFGPIALGLLLGFGGYSLLRTGLSPMTAVLGGILAGMAIDYAIQYLSMYESQRDMGATPSSASATSAVSITPAAFAAWATSVVGFLAIGASSVKALRDFALLGMLGLAGAFVVKMALMPLLLMLTDRRSAHAPTRSTFRMSLTPLLRKIARHSDVAIWACIAIFGVAVGILLLPGDILPLESDLTVMHPRPNAAIDAQNLISQRFGMHDWLIVDLRADSPRELVALAHRVDQRLRSPSAKDAGVVASFGLGALLPDPADAPAREAKIKAIDAEKVLTDYRSVIDDSLFNPDSREIRDSEKVLKAVLTSSPPTIESLVPYSRFAETILPRSAFEPGVKATEALTLVFIDHSMDLRASRDKAVLGVRAALAGEQNAIVTGLPVISYDAEQTVRHDLPRLSLLALVIVLLYLLAHFRSIAEASLAILPTVFSLVVLLAAMRVAGQRVNMVNLVAAPLLIGIDVDYGIFLVALARLKQVRAESTERLIARVAPVGHAVVICAAATIVGYGSLMWTSVPAIRSLGFVVAVGIGACLFSVLFLVTPIFLRLSRKGTRQPDGVKC